MPHTREAGHRFGNRQECLRGTRVDVLSRLEHWLRDGQDHRVFWLNGLAGTGKSTIAQTFAEISFADGVLGASFFCSRDFEDRSNLKAIIPTLAFQLAYRYPRFRERLVRVLKANPDVGRESLCSQMEMVIVGPFKTTGIRTLIIIDALDECKDEEPASAILSVLSRYVAMIPHVKFFITGRPEPRIRSGFRLKPLQPITEVLRLHEVEPSSVDEDIKLFFRTRLADIAETRSDCNFMEIWPSPFEIDILCMKAAGFFIYASTVVKLIASKYHNPSKRLFSLISTPQSTFRERNTRAIDDLYTKILDLAFGGLDEEFYFHFKSMVGTVLLVFNPLPIAALSTLLKTSATLIIFRSLHSVLLFPDDSAHPIRAFHKSFPDFLMDPSRCMDERFFIDPSVHHKEILLSCFGLMKERLKRNICGLDDYTPLDKVKDLPTHCKIHVGDTLEYACLFWTRHLVGTPYSDHDTEKVCKAVDEFFTTHFLFWIEVLSLTRNLDAGVYALNNIRQWYTQVSYKEFAYQSLCLCLV